MTSGCEREAIGIMVLSRFMEVAERSGDPNAFPDIDIDDELQSALTDFISLLATIRLNWV